jgi:hypothetical protein
MRAAEARPHRLDRALGLAADALDADDTPEARAALIRTLVHAGRLQRLLTLPPEIEALAVSRTQPAHVFAVSQPQFMRPSRLWHWPLDDGARPRDVPLTGIAKALALSDHSLVLALLDVPAPGATSSPGRLEVRDLRAPETVRHSVPLPHGFFHRLAVDRPGMRVCGVSHWEGLICWDLTRPRTIQIERAYPPRTVPDGFTTRLDMYDTPIALRADGAVLAHMRSTAIALTSLDSPDPVTTTGPALPDDRGLADLAFEGATVLALFRGGGLWAWSPTESGWQRRAAGDGGFGSGRFSSSGRSIVERRGRQPEFLSVTQVTPKPWTEPSERLEIPNLRPNRFLPSFSLDEYHLVAALSTSTVGTWDLQAQPLGLRPAAAADFRAIGAAFSADGAFVALLDYAGVSVLAGC